MCQLTILLPLVGLALFIFYINRCYRKRQAFEKSDMQIPAAKENSLYYSKDSSANLYYEAVIPNNVGAQLESDTQIPGAKENSIYYSKDSSPNLYDEALIPYNVGAQLA